MRKSAALLAATLVLSPFAASAQSIGGSYASQGTNIDGSGYDGTVEITLASDTTCVIEWKTGQTESKGICMRSGNAFAASYVLQDKVGLLVYQVMEDGSLDGIWTIVGQDGSGTEVLTPAE